MSTFPFPYSDNLTRVASAFKHGHYAPINLRLAAALIATLQLQDYRKRDGPSDPNPITDSAIPPDPSAQPGDGPTMMDGTPTVDIAELVGDPL